MVDFVIAGNLSFNVAQLPSLHSLLETVSGRRIVIPSRRKFMNELNGKSEKMKFALKALLSKQKYLCVTCDVWSSRGQSYLGVTVHFINQNFQRESYLLAFKQLHEKQNYIYLAQQLDDIFNDFDIKIEQITHIVTDGGSSFCKMFKEFGEEDDGSIVQDTPEEEDEELIVSENDEEDLNPLDIVQPFMQSDDGELFRSEILNFDPDTVEQQAVVDDYFSLNNSNPQPRLKLPSQRRCFSHLLNLASQDFEKQLPNNASKAFKSMYNKLHSLWNTTNRSSRGKTIAKENLGCVLKVPCETRWNAKFDSIKKINEIVQRETNFDKNGVNILIRRLKNELQSANHLQTLEKTDILIIEKYINVMTPVACALDILQGEFNCSQGLILPVILSMKHRIQIIDDTSHVGQDFKRTMLKVSYTLSNFKFQIGDNYII